MCHRHVNDIVQAGVSRFRPLLRSFYRRPAETVARDLLGRYLVRELNGERLVLRLVETEAYLGEPGRAGIRGGGGCPVRRTGSLIWDSPTARPPPGPAAAPPATRASISRGGTP